MNVNDRNEYMIETMNNNVDTAAVSATQESSLNHPQPTPKNKDEAHIQQESQNPSDSDKCTMMFNNING